MRVIEYLIKSIRNASTHNSEVEACPACILWPDKERQWETVIPRLQEALPELLVLGKYELEKRTGPAIWLRCAISGKIEKLEVRPERTPIIYLPGVSRQDLRAVENCPDELKPIVPLQYLGVIWSQVNAKDWTILAFLKTDQGGLGLDVSADNESKEAMKLAFLNLLDEDIDALRNTKLDKTYFNTLLFGGDYIRDILFWINDESAFKKSIDEAKWKAFVKICESNLGFNPQKSGVFKATENLANHKDKRWIKVWDRFCEAPVKYRNVPEQIKKCEMPHGDLFSDSSTYEGWPQWNDEKENQLKAELDNASRFAPKEIYKIISHLESFHAERRKSVWAELMQVPLANALSWLKVLSDITSKQIASGSADDIKKAYTESGWKADDAVLRTLACASSSNDNYKTVSGVIRAIYLPWIEESAKYLQKLDYPGETVKNHKKSKASDSECYLFVDGLRFDVGKRLHKLLAIKGYKVLETVKWAALPTVTTTGKPSATPVKDKIYGSDIQCIDFEPCVADTGQSLKGGYHLKKLLNDNGFTSLGKNEYGTTSGSAWCEFGDLDHEGHDKGWKVVCHIDVILTGIVDQVTSLLNVGWKKVKIVTDHGWLLVPGGLPKVELPKLLTESKWGRCALIKEGALCSEKQVPWYWNPEVSIAVPSGVSCYKNGEEYSHGGISLQECLIPELEISTEDSLKLQSVSITDIKWKGLRCNIVVEGNLIGMTADIRKEAGSSDSSIVVSRKQFKEDGYVSLVVENEDLEGTMATLVILNDKGQLIAQKELKVCS